MINQQILNLLKQQCPNCCQKWIFYRNTSRSQKASCLDCIIQVFILDHVTYVHRGEGWNDTHADILFPLIEWEINPIDNEARLYPSKEDQEIVLPDNLPFSTTVDRVLKLVPFI